MANDFAFPKPPMMQKIVGADGSMNREWLKWFSFVFSQISAAAYNPSSVAITGGSIGGTTAINVTGVVYGSNISGSVTGVNTGDQTISLNGDVTGSGTEGITATISDGAVTYAKMQAATQAALVGASAAGALGEVTIGAGLTLSGGVLSASGGVSGLMLADTQSPYLYIGKAATGTATSAAAWQIRRVVIATGATLYANGVTTYTNVWDNHLSLPYS